MGGEGQKKKKKSYRPTGRGGKTKGRKIWKKKKGKEIRETMGRATKKGSANPSKGPQVVKGKGQKQPKGLKVNNWTSTRKEEKQKKITYELKLRSALGNRVGTKDYKGKKLKGGKKKGVDNRKTEKAKGRF